MVGNLSRLQRLAALGSVLLVFWLLALSAPCAARALADSGPQADGAFTAAGPALHAAAASKDVPGKEARIADGVYVISSKADKNAVLGVRGASLDDGAKAQAQEANFTPTQRWRFKRLSDGTYRITNVGSGKALAVAKANVGKGTTVRQKTWKASKAQKWIVKKDARGVSLVSAASSAYSLCFEKGKTAAGTKAAMYAPRASKAYRLRLTRVEPVLEDGTYVIASKVTGKLVQAQGGKTGIRTNIEQGTKAASLEKVFSFEYDPKTGYYRILSAASGLAVDVANGADFDGVNVHLYTPNGSQAQQWALVKNGDGTFSLRSATGGRMLDLQDASSAVGANLQLHASNGSDAQRWQLKAKKRWLLDGTYTFASTAGAKTALSVSRSSTKAGANVKTARTAKTAVQQWKVTYKPKAKAYTIRNMNSKLMLEAKGSAKSGANVRQAKATGKRNQLWKPRIAPGGIVFCSAANPQVALSVSGTGDAGGNVKVAPDEQARTQKFRLRNTAIPSFKVYLNPGHGWNSNDNGAWDTGAQGNGHQEAEFTHELARLVQGYCESYGIEVVNGEQFNLAFWDRLPKAVALKCDVMVSIHFDWSGAGVSGTHTMVGVQGKAPGSDLLNDIIHRHLVAATGLRDLGTFSRSDITAVNGAIPSMLMEVCFMDNAHDVNTYLTKRDKIAKAIADGILEASQHSSLHR